MEKTFEVKKEKKKKLKNIYMKKYKYTNKIEKNLVILIYIYFFLSYKPFTFFHT